MLSSHRKGKFLWERSDHFWYCLITFVKCSEKSRHWGLWGCRFRHRAVVCKCAYIHDCCHCTCMVLERTTQGAAALHWTQPIVTNPEGAVKSWSGWLWGKIDLCGLQRFFLFRISVSVTDRTVEGGCLPSLETPTNSPSLSKARPTCHVKPSGPRTRSGYSQEPEQSLSSLG